MHLCHKLNKPINYIIFRMCLNTGRHVACFFLQMPSSFEFHASLIRLLKLRCQSFVWSSEHFLSVQDEFMCSVDQFFPITRV